MPDTSVKLQDITPVKSTFDSDDQLLLINATGEARISKDDFLEVTQAELDALKSALRSGAEEDAEWHLGFYLDENGDLCQVDEEVNNG